jgi:hypothetical protein
MNVARSLLERLSALEKSIKRTNHLQAEEPPHVHSGEPNGRQDGFPLEDALEDTALDDGLTRLESLGFELEDEGNGPFYHRALRYDVLTLHGTRRYADLAGCDLHGLERVVGAPLSVHALRFYDTETTGLGTGAGTFPFLHAVGELTEDELVIHQYFVDDFSREFNILTAMMSRHFADDVTIVSFNGKSFDWPLLQSRLSLYRLHEFLRPVPQADLLYPSRRLWKHTLGSVTLSNVERGVLELYRTDDLPGKEAPNRYFEYAERKDARLLEPVFSHNASDVCTLVSLTAVLADVLAGRQVVHSAKEHVALARWYDEWAHHELAERCFDIAVSLADADWQTFWKRSMYHKRKGDWQVATKTWMDMLERFPWTVQPAVELAKYAEHRARAYEDAERWTKLAIERTREGQRLLRRRQLLSEGLREDSREDFVLRTLEHRLNRILRKKEKRP